MFFHQLKYFVVVACWKVGSGPARVATAATLVVVLNGLNGVIYGLVVPDLVDAVEYPNAGIVAVADPL